MSFLHLVRHGQTAGFPFGAYVDLTPKGVAQAEAFGRWWRSRDVRPTAVFVGPRARHRQSHAWALGAAGGDWPEPVFLDTLDEHRGADIFGAWVRDHAASDPMWAALARGEAVPGMRRRALQGFQRVMRSWARGEVASEHTYTRFQDDADQALAKMTAGTEAGQQVLAFTSAGTIAAMTRTVLGVQDPAMSASLSFELVNASLTTVRFSGDRRTLHRFNAVPHLDAADVTAV